MSGPRRAAPLLAWIEDRSAGAPAALRERVLALAAELGPTGPELPPPPRALAAVAMRVLDRVTLHPGDRRIALDLLAADGLITLALVAQAERDPEGLEEFAADLLAAPSSS